MRAAWFGLWGLVAALPVNAQVARSRQELRVEAGVAAWESAITGAVAASHQIGLFRAGRLRLGYGVRYSLIARTDQAEFTVARASLIQQGIREPVLIDQSRNHALNLAFYANYRVLSAVEAGFNIDVIGFGFGPARIADSRSTDPRYQGRYSATPSSFNLLQGSRTGAPSIRSYMWRTGSGLARACGPGRATRLRSTPWRYRWPSETTVSVIPPRSPSCRSP